MNHNSVSLILVFALSLLTTSCNGWEVKDPNFMPPDEVIGKGQTIQHDSLPTAGSEIAYTPSMKGKPYFPITVQYSSGYPPVTNWTSSNTRIIPYMADYKPEITSADQYRKITNKYGSYTKGERQAATGRFYTKKINGRWWIVDPEGFLHYERSVNSFRTGSSQRNKAAWTKKFGSNSAWVAKSRTELASIGFHGTGAFSTNGYEAILDYNKNNPDSPLALAPSFGFLSTFRTTKKLSYPGGESMNIVGLVLNEDWGKWCEEYAAQALAPYVNNPNVLGIFSDNEINFTTLKSRILDRFLAISDHSDQSYTFAQSFMQDKGTDKVTDDLNDEFAGLLAEKYYKAVKAAITKVDHKMLYLGTRLHGTPKYMKHVVEAAGKYCDIISINYYSRWSPELDTYVKYWAGWADKPFMVTEFYTKAADSELSNQSGAGFTVPTQKERAWAYQHFTLGLLEAPNCVGWHWFKYQDDDGNDNNSKPANKGVYDNEYNMYPYLSSFMQQLNFNVYSLIDYFDK
ncbi:hypothetical protein [Hallella bergensis]|uniref:hypothetical protein n=1 Tax=Hallella bergensis TaxID=242750 RepID=UPI0039904FF6